MKKKILSILLAIVMVLAIAPVSVFAEDDTLLLGDVDGDGYTTSADARSALRTAAGLELADNVNIMDITGDGKTTAEDARKILRVSAMIDKIENAAPARISLDCDRSESIAIKMVVSDNTVNSVVGDTIVISVSAENVAGLENGNLFFNYDSEYLEFVSFKRSSSELDMSFCDSISAEDVACGFVFMNAYTKSDIDIVEITFTVKKSGESLLNCTVGTWDGTEVPADCSISIDIHEHDYAKVVTLPTCTEGGYTTYTCSICGDSYVDNYTNERGHAFTYHDEPSFSCLEIGRLVAYCYFCGYSYTVEEYTGECSYSEGSLNCDVCSKYALSYEINNGEVTITGCDTSISGNIVIPDTIEGYPVTTIDWYAFYGCTSLESVTIPDSVTTIGEGAFSLCESLESVTIPDSVTSIGDYAFGYYHDEDSWEFELVVVDGFIIYGFSGSAAEVYTNENGITFLILTDEPTTDEPVTDDPTTDEPTTDEPTTDEPVPDEPVPDEPTTDEPVPDEPTTDEPVPDEPTTDKPVQDTSTVLTPNADSNITVTDTVAASAPEMSVEAIIASVENENVQILDKDGKELTKDAFVGTGSKINILDKDGNILSAYEVMVKSDVDGNGKITPADARLALRAAAGIDTISGVYATAANYDEKETISTSDARMILRKAAGLE